MSDEVFEKWCETVARKMGDIDFERYGDSMCLKFGGDGDNGEHLITLLREAAQMAPMDRVLDEAERLGAVWPEIVSLPVQTTRSQGLDGPMNEHEELVFASARKLPDLMTPSLCYSNGWVDAIGFLRAKTKLVDVAELMSALEFYAGDETKQVPCPDNEPGCAVFHFKKVPNNDGGKRAREALAKFREGKCQP